MSQLRNEQFARLLLDKIAEAITDIEVSNSFTLATAGQLITMEDTIWPETRVAVMGDSDFAANGGLGIQGNRDLFMNTIGWLSQQENLISIRPKEADDRRITLTATQQSNIAWLSLLVIPAAVFGTGIFTWWRRR